MFPDKKKTFLMDGPVGKLEVATTWPIEKTPLLVMVICHPHPLHLGTMNNKVVTTLARCAQILGMPSVRFNFRGVGQSAGEFANAIGEQDDALSVISWVHEQLPNAHIVLAGFSFGSYVAAAVAARVNRLQALISVAPPVHHYDFNAIELPSCPWLVLMGDQDEVVPLAAVQQWAEQNATHLDYQQIADCSHFFHGQLITLRERVIGWLKK
jgi:uncharacterized protein